MSTAWFRRVAAQLRRLLISAVGRMVRGWNRSRVALSATVVTIFTCLPVMVSTPALAGPGEIVDHSGLIPFEQAFFAFEVESALNTLKETPIWDEIEQMLDSPYALQLDPNVGGNSQGWSSFRSTLPRRRSFVYRNGAGQPCAPGSAGCVEQGLPRHIVHPLNYNHMTGEELRLLNPAFEATEWEIPDELHVRPDGTYGFTSRAIEVSAGEERMEEADEEASVDFNSPIASDEETCIIAIDQFFSEDAPGGAVPEGSTICGADPGEPGYSGFGTLGPRSIRDEQYSTPALPLDAFSADNRVPGWDISFQLGVATTRLFDPAGCLGRNAESPGSCSGAGFINRLRKPTLRSTPASTPNYLQNEVATTDPLNLVPELKPSNENDFVRGDTRAQKLTARNEAATLGKALFWDMQIGSDSVQACGSCHFNAGADDRTKNQLNPNHVAVPQADLTLQIGNVGPQGNRAANYNLQASDFPFHRGGQDSTGPGNDVNDVASSMGVRFRLFRDIPTPGTAAFGTAAVSGVRTLLPDLGQETPDPIPAFQGLRRVEPRNTPTFINTALNFDNFWDGRARHDFNGGSVFGPADPQAHVFVASSAAGPLVATRQMIRFASLGSLATGPALSEFEMSFLGRNWAKLGKKLLQGSLTGAPVNRVVPLANQLVSTSDSVLGRYSNQGGSECAGLANADRSVAGATAAGKPGLCISYPALIRRAYYPALWQSTSAHLNGCYTDGNVALHPNQCSSVGVTVEIPVFDEGSSQVLNSPRDPFDNYVLTIAAGAASATNTDQFSQMEANMSLFFGMAVHIWGTLLISDDAPFDRFFDENPDSFTTFGESGEAGIALDLPNCFGPNGTNGVQPCFVEVGRFKRDPNVIARVGLGAVEGGTCIPAAGCTPTPAGGTRAAGTVDPLMGMDFFLGSNLSLKNPNFRSLRCGECHASGTLTDHTVEISHQLTFNDWVQEFVAGFPGIELAPEPLGRDRVISGFSLEGELQENAQDGIERNIADFALDAGGFPKGQALFDNGVYNIGVTPIANDVSRGGNDAFGWPLSLAVLALKNLGGLDYHPGGNNVDDGFALPANGGNPLPNFDPEENLTGGGLLGPTAQDQQINPGFEEEPEDPQLPPYLAPWASNIPVGDESNQDEVFFGLNSLAQEPIMEGYLDAFGPFNPAAILGEAFNSANQPALAAWPNVNRVNAQGSFKAPTLRNVEKTGPYFHNGGKLTLRQQLDFYLQGGDFPGMNSSHRDFLILNGMIEDEALGGVDVVTGQPEFTAQEKEEIIVAVIDFLLELTDERVAFQRAPFDQPEIFVPLDGLAPDNGSLSGAVPVGRSGFINNLGNGLFRQVPATGAGGLPSAVPNFLDVASSPRLVGPAAFCGEANNHYCH